MSRDYPPEYDEPEQCEVCLRNTDDCDCPECPVCTVAGSGACYDAGHLRPLTDSVWAFCDHIGIEPIGEALRAIDKHNTEHVWLVLHGPLPWTGKERIYYHDAASLRVMAPWLRLAGVGVGGIAWDGSDWEWSAEETFVKPGGRPWAWTDLDAMRVAFHDALAEQSAVTETEEASIE